jgi:hypothetical protein
MRLLTETVVGALLMGAWIPAACALEIRPAVHPAGGSATHLLTPEDGLAILSAALDSRHRPNAGSDCSHLVHAIYAKAGFPYTYQRSSDLYAGIAEFRRLQHPQPGDLIVWPGHAGIVVNPTQRTFFSALRTGFGVDAWDVAYWRHRGTPRFYRYLKASPVLVIAEPSPNLKAAGLEGPRRPEPAPAETDDPAPVDDSALESASVRTPLSPAVPALPSTAVVQAARPKPSQVQAALLAAFSASAQALEVQHMLPPFKALFIFDRISIENVSLKDHYGWAEVRISGPATIAGNTAELKKHCERQRWTLTRYDHSTWELVFPTDVVYLPREAAARILAHQLAALTDADPEQPADQARKLQLARLLSVLLEAPGQ